MEGGGVEPHKCSRSKRASLELTGSGWIDRVRYQKPGALQSIDCASLTAHQDFRQICCGRGGSEEAAILLEQRDHLSDLSGVEVAGFDLVSELSKIASSLSLSSASRAFSLLSCAISLSSFFIRCFRSIDLISRSTTGCQLSLESQRRQRGKEESNSDLLIEPQSGAPEQVDMVVSGEQRDQGEQDAGDQRDPALKVESQQHRSQPQHRFQDSTSVSCVASVETRSVCPHGPGLRAAISIDFHSRGQVF